MRLDCAPVRYLAALRANRLVLWCYLMWYAATVLTCFDPSPALWLNSLGISAVIGIALNLSVTTPPSSRTDRWQVFRLFLMPFCVSRFAALIKGHGYVLIVPPRLADLAVSVGMCSGFLLLVAVIKYRLGRAARALGP